MLTKCLLTHLYGSILSYFLSQKMSQSTGPVSPWRNLFHYRICLLCDLSSLIGQKTSSDFVVSWIFLSFRMRVMFFPTFYPKWKWNHSILLYTSNIPSLQNIYIYPINSWEIDGETVETVSDFILGGSKITADGDCSHEIKRCLLLGKKVMTNLDSILKSRDITLPTKVHLVKAMVFSSGHVWMWELDCEEGWAPKNWSFWTVVLEKTLESPLDCKEIQPVHPKGDQS